MSYYTQSGAGFTGQHGNKFQYVAIRVIKINSDGRHPGKYNWLVTRLR